MRSYRKQAVLLITATLFAAITALYEHLIKAGQTNFFILLSFLIPVFYFLLYMLFVLLDNMRKKCITVKKGEAGLYFAGLLFMWLPWLFFVFREI